MIVQTIAVFIVLTLVISIFNPYKAFESIKEPWKVRELSFGHPLYWKMRYCNKENIARFNQPACDTNYTKHHSFAYNRPLKQRCFLKNIMYIE